MIDYASQAAGTFLAIADQRNGTDAAQCGVVFDHLVTAARMRDCFRDALVRHQLSDLQFATLVVLFEADPKPVSMADLAARAAVSRSAMTDALDKLEELRFAIRIRDRCDRRLILVRITIAGRGKADQAINDYLCAVTHAAGHIIGRAQSAQQKPLSSGMDCVR